MNTTTNTKRERNLAVVKLRTRGPSQRIRGEFLAEYITSVGLGNLGRMKVWNAKARRWFGYQILESDPVVVSIRGATFADAERFGLASVTPENTILR